MDIEKAPTISDRCLARSDHVIRSPVTAPPVRNIHRIPVNTSLILSRFFDSHNCLRSGLEAARAGYPVRTFDQSTRNQQNAQENKGTYTRVPSAVFLTADFHGMSYPASLRTCGRYEFFSEYLGILIRTGIRRYRFWSISQFLLSAEFSKLYRPVYLLLLLLKMKLSRFCKSHKKRA